MPLIYGWRKQAELGGLEQVCLLNPYLQVALPEASHTLQNLYHDAAAIH